MKTIYSAMLTLLLAAFMAVACKKNSNDPPAEHKEERLNAYYVNNKLGLKLYYNDLKKLSKLEVIDGDGTVADAATYEYDADSILKKKIVGGVYYEYKRNEAGQIVQSNYVYAGGAVPGDKFEVKKSYSYDETGRLKDVKGYNKEDKYIFQTRYYYYDNGSLKLVERFYQGLLPARRSRLEFSAAAQDDLTRFEQLHRSLGEPVPFEIIQMQLTDQMIVKEYEPDGYTVKSEMRYEMKEQQYQASGGFLESQETQVSFILPAKAPEIVKYKYEYIKL